MALVKYDNEANAMYFRLGKGKRRIKSTIALGKDRFIDVDPRGKIVGVEIILPKVLPKEAQQALKRSKDTIELVQ
ncbi:MAG: DUF2283 domain-containing protein [Thaumarchaeota archaeon]|nr:MAG: DUF2283 domain-containing protein [Nitrososphaerota archaeon]